MTTFDERERSFEKKFAIDQELRFRATARRDALLGQWAAAKLGLSGSAVGEYVAALRKVEIAGKGGQDVFQKVLRDLLDKGVAITAAELREVMQGFMAQALAQIEGEAKGA